jgi:hypothetical protein
MQAHPSDEAMGYELSGNRALFKGDLKLVLNLPPVGDGLWHLYNLREDPGETRDLQGSLPLAFSALQAEHAAWSSRHGVLPMPAGYSPARQVALNWLVLQALPGSPAWAGWWLQAGSAWPSLGDADAIVVIVKTHFRTFQMKPSRPAFSPSPSAALLAAVLWSLPGASTAADGFRVRYPLSGSLGGDLLASAERPGFFGSAVLTRIAVDKVTDDAGEARQQVKQGSITTLPIAGLARTTTYSGSVAVDVAQLQTAGNLFFGYLSEPLEGGSHWSLLVNLPYTTRLVRQARFSGETPALSTLSPALTSPPLPPGAPAAAQAKVQAAFDTTYQASLLAQSENTSGRAQGLGDAEISAAWLKRQGGLKWTAGLTLTLPTGKYDSQDPLSIGFGRFHTLRPGVAAAWEASSAWTLGGRASLGFNSRNRDNQIKSGNFASLDLAAACRTSVGAFGPHLLWVHQYTDDQGGPLGANRFSTTSAGGFYATSLQGVGLNLAYMQVVNSRNALSGSFLQMRASTAF